MPSVDDFVNKSRKVFGYLNNRFLRERGMASTPKMEYQVFLCIFQKNLAMATLGLKEMGKIPLGRQGKRSLKGRAFSKKITKFTVAVSRI